MSNENEEILDEKNEETPEQKASKIDKKYNEQMAFIAKVLGTDPKEPIKLARTVGADITANVVARMFKQRDEQLEQEVFDGLNKLVDTHFKAEDEIRKKEDELKKLRTEKRKDFIKVASAWRSKIDQQEIHKESYAEALRYAIQESKDEK